ncbi:MAG: hypothetical protein ABSH41_11795 [Syntrophobacteraceae bacterium]
MAQTGKITPRKVWIIFILFLALVPASCASTGAHDEKKLLELLKASIETYTSAYRWEDYDAAAAFVPADRKEQFWAEVDRFKGKIRIADYQVREVTPEEKGHRGTAIIYLQYWRVAAPNLLTLTITQKWFFIEKDKCWKVSDSGFGAITRARAGY